MTRLSDNAVRTMLVAGVAAAAAWVSSRAATGHQETSVTREREEPAAPPATSGSDATPLQRITQALAVLTGLVSIVYVAGGVVLAARLERASLPWEPVVGQLPREFLVSIGLGQVFLPAFLTAGCYALYRLLWRPHAPAQRRFRDGGWVNVGRWFVHLLVLAALAGLVTYFGWSLAHGAGSDELPAQERSSPSPLWWVIVVGVLILLAIVATELRGRLAAQKDADWHSLKSAASMTAIYGAVFIPAFIAIFAEAPFSSAKVCAPSGFANVGLLIGHTSDGVYLGERKPPPSFDVPDFDPRITVIPTAEVGSLFVGSTNRGGAECDSGAAMSVVLANAGADAVRESARQARDAAELAATSDTAAAAVTAVRDAGQAAQAAGSEARRSAQQLLFVIGTDAVVVSQAGETATSAGQRATRAADSLENSNAAPGPDELAAADAAASAAADAYRRLRDAVREALHEAVADSG